jgi:hypothetical protein
MRLGDGVRLEGYWQSSKYFADWEQLVRSHFTLRTPTNALNKDWLARINDVAAISIHVRRGDYVSNARTAEVHGSCEPEYYVRGARFLAEQMAVKPEYFLFSDDIGWARENIKLPHTTHYVEHNGPNDDYEDLRLMSSCRHHIIANSTFSWWAAWLNPSQEKCVVAPKRWFRDPDMDDGDLIPAGWVRM